ncbi:MAG: YicC/YloC family endoribonuclease [Gemmatimonadota bacterium]
MIRSMTGFGSASREFPDGTLTVELKSVNHRHLNISFRLPPGADAWEAELRARLGQRARRGQVSFVVLAEAAPGSGGEWRMDRERVLASLETLRALQEEYDLPGEIDLSLVARTAGDLLRQERMDQLGWVDADMLGSVVDDAVSQLVGMREIEGRRLEDDLLASLDGVDDRLDDVERLTPERLEREHERLRRAVAELAGKIRLDEGRLEQEIAVIADRWDISEELVRARAHVAAFRELLASEAAEPVGRRLSFLLQEMNREINTVGSKANDARISGHVVEIKNGLERLREQVENVE